MLAINCVQNREVNLESLSETIDVGYPWAENILSMRRWAVSIAVICLETGNR